MGSFATWPGSAPTLACREAKENGVDEAEDAGVVTNNNDDDDDVGAE